METLKTVWAWIVVVTVILTLVGLASNCWAAAYLKSFSCKANSWSAKIIKVGDSAGHVRRYCGEPDNVIHNYDVGHTKWRGKAFRKHKGVNFKGSSDSIKTYIETWEYYKTRLPVRITISAGKVVRIEVGD